MTSVAVSPRSRDPEVLESHRFDGTDPDQGTQHRDPAGPLMVIVGSLAGKATALEQAGEAEPERDTRGGLGDPLTEEG